MCRAGGGPLRQPRKRKVSGGALEVSFYLTPRQPPATRTLLIFRFVLPQAAIGGETCGVTGKG